MKNIRQSGIGTINNDLLRPASSAFVFDTKEYAKFSTFRRPAVKLRQWKEASPMSKYRVAITKGFHKSVSRHGRKFSKRRENKLCFGR